MSDATKRCGTCRNDLPISAFNRRTASRDGLCYRCRECDSVYKKAHRARNIDVEKAKDRARYLRDRDGKLAASREYYRQNRESIRAKSRAQWQSDPELYRARQREYRRRTPEATRRYKRADYERRKSEIRAYSRSRYWADPERFRAEVLEWQRENPDIANERNRRRRARQRNAIAAVISPEALAQKLAFWGWRCWMCGGDPAAWDHVKPISRGGPHMLANLRPACQPCNSSKGARWPLPRTVAV